MSGPSSRPADAYGPTRPVLLPALLAACAIMLVGLGIWQIERRAQKLALIAAVEARVHREPAAAPGPASWPHLGFGTDAYRHVLVHGTYLARADTLVQAATELGPGFWVMTPLRTEYGWTVLVNRGFVSADDPSHPLAPGPFEVTGLLRISEPRGRFPARKRSAARPLVLARRSGDWPRTSRYRAYCDGALVHVPTAVSLRLEAYVPNALRISQQTLQSAATARRAAASLPFLALLGRSARMPVVQPSP